MPKNNLIWAGQQKIIVTAGITSFLTFGAGSTDGFWLTSAIYK